MAELVYQTWERITGKPWSAAAAGGFTDGSYASNVALQQKLLGGWNPYSPKAAAKPKAKAPSKAKSPPKAKAKPKAKAPSPGPVPVDPGLMAQQWEAMITEQKRAAEAQELLTKQAQADARRLQEAQLGANPADFVAYELYKRTLQKQGYTPQGQVRTNPEIQNLFSTVLGLDSGPSIGTGRFGVDLPATQGISRSEFTDFSSTDQDILSSFLRGGVKKDGKYLGINPEDYFKELDKGFIPTTTTQPTQYRF